MTRKQTVPECSVPVSYTHLLMALCTPNEMLKELQDTNQMGKLMVMNEAVKMLPIGEVWEEYCRRENVCDDFHFYDEIEKYESEVLADRA